MAHYVICKICEKRFDRDTSPTIKIGRRYAHKQCAEESGDPEILQQNSELQELHDYLKNLFREGYDYSELNKQILYYMSKEGYTASGILKSLIYWYEVEGHSTEKANNRIGIVPYIYKQAYDYYYNMYVANQTNQNKDLDEYIHPEVIEVRIKKPQREIPKFRLFDLDN